MNDQPLVSVIIPVYNGAEFLADAIKSATTQTYRNLEIIVVDDGSRDASLEIANRLAANDSRIRVVAQANGGVAKARNAAITVAQGEFIAPLDADDLWLPTKIERQVACMVADGDKCGFVYTWWATVDTAARILDRSPRWTVAGDRFETLLLINFTGNASAPLFRKLCLVEAGGYNPKLAEAKSGGCEDFEVVLRIAARYRIGVVPEILMGYRRSPGSMSSNCDRMWRSRQLVIDGLRDFGVAIRPAVLRDADRQFCMYLAALSFWSGNMQQAIRWGIRCGLRRAFLFAPSLLKTILKPQTKDHSSLIMRPGQALDTSTIPEPLLPFNRILSLQ